MRKGLGYSQQAKSLLLSLTEMSDFYGKDTTFLCLQHFASEAFCLNKAEPHLIFQKFFRGAETEFVFAKSTCAAI